MIMFFLIFLSLYGGMHMYAYYRLRSIIQPGMAVPLVMLLLIFAPLLVRLAEHYGTDNAAYYIAMPGFTWMGFIFLFCVFLGSLDICRFACVHIRWKALKALPSINHCKLALVLALLATIYSLFEARYIRTELVTMHPKPGQILNKPVRVVQISDVHLGLMMDEVRLGSIISTIRNAKPDILVSTGDLVDGRLSRQESRQKQENLAAMIRNIPTPMGKYAITGNHEYYAGIEEALALTQNAGFRILRNETVVHDAGITISGIDDPASARTGVKVPGNEPELIKALSAAPFHLLLKHRPTFNNASDGVIDLQLSGHTHKGQLIPFYPLTWLKFPIHSGTTKTGKGTTIHVSRGTGTWGPPMRFLAPPEVTIIDIVP